MKAGLAWFAVLAIALLTTSLQAKLGLYRPEHSQEHLVSKAFKLSECRLERAAADSPVVTLSVVTATTALDHRDDSEVEFPDSTPPRIPPVFASRSHWFRPPPVRS